MRTSKKAEYKHVKNRLCQLEEMIVAHHLNVNIKLSSFVRILCVHIQQEAHILQPLQWPLLITSRVILIQHF